MERYSKTYPQSNLRRDAQRTSANLGIVTARSAHATPETIVLRSRHLMAVDDGARNVAEDPARFVYNQRGARLDATPEGASALMRHAHEHARVSAEGQRETWRTRRAA